MDQEDVARSCSCIDEEHDDVKPAIMGRVLHALLPVALAILVAAVGALVLACGDRPSKMLTAPAGCEWAPLPLRVQIDPALATRSPVLFRAAEAWSREMRTPAVVFVASDPDVTVSEASVGVTGHRVAVYTTCGERGKARSAMVLEAGMDSVALHDFAAHGFGHALGVAHSTNQRSVMQGTLETGLLAGEPGPDEDFPPVYRVTEGDAQAALAQRRGRP
jgi:hypothetical protein